MGNKALKLSLTMIVRNEENCIGRCLESVKNIADEIIVVDTGSDDKTIEICKSYGAHVYNFEWNNSFADARNYGLDKASGDWIIWLDADEEVSVKNSKRLLRNKCFDKYDVLSVPLVNFYGNDCNVDQSVRIAQPRLFRRSKGYRFENKIHEWLKIPFVNENKNIGFLNLEILHYGYLNSIIENKQKHKRNVTLLLTELDENKENAWTHYYLAAEYYRVADYLNAFEHVNKSIQLFLDQGIIPPPSMIYTLKYSILIETGSWDGAWPSIKSAVKMFPDYVDLKFYMGLILYKKNMTEDALKSFEDCIKLGENNLDYMTQKGLGSYRAWYFKGLCLSQLDRKLEAMHSFIQAIELSDNFTEAKTALSELEEKMGRQ